MYDTRVKRCDDRLVSVQQPHIRPIVRGKAGARSKLGPKLDMSLSRGIARVEAIGFDAYHEGCILIAACERYRQCHGSYPAKVLVDKAYLSRANRAYMKLRGIHHAGKPLGRLPKDEAKRAAYDAALRKAERPGEQSPIEGLFSLAKRRYRLGRLPRRSLAVTLGEVFLIAIAINLLSELNRVTALFRGGSTCACVCCAVRCPVMPHRSLAL